MYKTFFQNIEAPLTPRQLTVAFRLFVIGMGMGTIVFIVEKVIQNIGLMNTAAKVSLSVIKQGVQYAWK